MLVKRVVGVTVCCSQGSHSVPGAHDQGGHAPPGPPHFSRRAWKLNTGIRCRIFNRISESVGRDDNRDAAESLAQVLQFRGHDVRLAADGAEALKIADQFRPDAVFLDIGMPKLNGYATAERIRGENWGRDVLLVAVTGWGQAEDKQRAKDAGFDAHFTKPLDPSVLDGLLAPLTSIQ